MHSRGMMWVGALIGLALASVPRIAAAQGEDEPYEYVTGETETVQADAPWDFFLRVGLGLTFGSSDKVIGNADGNTWTIGFNLEGRSDFLSNGHELRSALLIGENFTRTPVIDEFVKTADGLEFETIYFYHIPSAPWIGPFARFGLATSIFSGTDVRPGEVDYAIFRVDGTTSTVTAAQLDLTDPFQPFLLKESAGIFFRPETEETFQFEVLLGFGSRQTFADDQLAVADAEDTPAIEVLELESFVQAGLELVLNIWGAIAESRLGYRAGADFLIPFINDLGPEDDRSAFELTNIDVFAGLTLQIVEWASLEYQFHALRETQLLDEFQIGHLLLFTLGYTIVDTRAEREAAAAAAAAVGAEGVQP